MPGRRLRFLTGAALFLAATLLPPAKAGCTPLGLWEYLTPGVEGEPGILGYRYRVEKRRFRCTVGDRSFSTTLVREHYLDLPPHLFYFRHPPDRPSVLLITKGADSESLKVAGRLIEEGAVNVLILQSDVALSPELESRVPLVIRVKAGVGELLAGAPEGLPWSALSDILEAYNVAFLRR